MRTTKKQLQHLVYVLNSIAKGTYELDKNALGYSLYRMGPERGTRVLDILATDCRLTATEMKYYLMGIINTLQA